MPRYFFNVRDGKDIPDLVGTELPGIDAVRTVAIQAAGEAIIDLGTEFWGAHKWQMIVTDENGHEVLTLNFSGALGTSQ